MCAVCGHGSQVMGQKVKMEKDTVTLTIALFAYCNGGTIFNVKSGLGYSKHIVVHFRV